MDTIHSKKGRPPVLDEIGERNLVEKLTNSEQQQTSVKEKDFPNLICEEAEETLNRRNISICVDSADPKTVKKYKRKLNLKKVTGQSKSSARITAEKDLRNNFSMAVLLKAYSENLNPALKMNMDYTQFYIHEETGKVLVVKNGKNLEGKKPATFEHDSSFGISVKYIHLHNAIQQELQCNSSAVRCSWVLQGHEESPEIRTNRNLC